MENNTKNIELVRLWKDHQEYILSEYPNAKEILSKREARTISTFVNHLLALGRKAHEKTKKAEVTQV